MDTEFIDRLDAELQSVGARIDEQKKLIAKADNLDLEKASADLRALLVRLETLEETRRKIEEQSHGA